MKLLRSPIILLLILFGTPTNLAADRADAGALRLEIRNLLKKDALANEQRVQDLYNTLVNDSNQSSVYQTRNMYVKKQIDSALDVARKARALTIAQEAKQAAAQKADAQRAKQLEDNLQAAARMFKAAEKEAEYQEGIQAAATLFEEAEKAFQETNKQLQAAQKKEREQLQQQAQARQKKALQAWEKLRQTKEQLAQYFAEKYKQAAENVRLTQDRLKKAQAATQRTEQERLQQEAQQQEQQAKEAKMAAEKAAQEAQKTFEQEQLSSAGNEPQIPSVAQAPNTITDIDAFVRTNNLQMQELDSDTRQIYFTNGSLIYERSLVGGWRKQQAAAVAQPVVQPTKKSHQAEPSMDPAQQQNMETSQRMALNSMLTQANRNIIALRAYNQDEPLSEAQLTAFKQALSDTAKAVQAYSQKVQELKRNNIDISTDHTTRLQGLLKDFQEVYTKKIKEAELSGLETAAQKAVTTLEQAMAGQLSSAIEQAIKNAQEALAVYASLAQKDPNKEQEFSHKLATTIAQYKATRQ